MRRWYVMFGWIGMIAAVGCCFAGCTRPPSDEKPRSGICMADGMALFQHQSNNEEGLKLLGLGDSLLVYSDSVSFAVHDTLHRFRKVRLIADSTWSGWVRADQLALDCAHGAITHDHAELYADDLTHLDTLSYMQFVGTRPSHLSGYRKIYVIHPGSKKMVSGLIPIAHITTDPGSTAFAVSYESNRNKPSWLQSLFRISDKKARESEFFTRIFRRELDSARSHRAEASLVAGRMAAQFRRDSTTAVSSYLLDFEGNLSDSPLRDSYVNQGVNFRTYAAGKGVIRIEVACNAAESTRQDSVMVNGIAVHFVDIGFCRDQTTITVRQNNKQIYKRVVEFAGGD